MRSLSNSIGNQRPPKQPALSSIPSTALPIVRLMRAMNEYERRREWMAQPESQSLRTVDGNLIGQTYIINGPTLSGKSSLVLWALRHHGADTAIVDIDCAIYKTQMQFIQRLTRQVGEKAGEKNLDRRAIASESIKFDELSRVIMKHERKMVILIRHADKLTQNKRQILLYNLLEWISTDIKNYVGLVFTTRVLYLKERFDKRVKSRLSDKQLFVPRPSTQGIKNILVHRVKSLMEEERQLNGRHTLCFRVFSDFCDILSKSRTMMQVIDENQGQLQREVPYYLQAMKLVLSAYPDANYLDLANNRGLMQKDLNAELTERLAQQFKFIFPMMSFNLIQTCTLPQYVIIALIRHMIKNQRLPYRFKTIYELYLEFKQRLVTSEGVGSAFLYSKSLLERGVLRLQELGLLELESRQQSLWNCDIKYCIFPDDIEASLKEVPNLPDFVHYIIKS